jgi:hypothetical protein
MQKLGEMRSDGADSRAYSIPDESLFVRERR